MYNVRYIQRAYLKDRLYFASNLLAPKRAATQRKRSGYLEIRFEKTLCVRPLTPAVWYVILKMRAFKYVLVVINQSVKRPPWRVRVSHFKSFQLTFQVARACFVSAVADEQMGFREGNFAAGRGFFSNTLFLTKLW